MHALLSESDGASQGAVVGHKVFLSTLSLRRATAIDVFLAVWAVISIHALLAESDFFDTVQIVIVIIFLSTLSLRRAT